MRIWNLFSLLGTGLALLSLAFAAPIPSPGDLVVVKRSSCYLTGCRIAEPSNPDSASQSTDLRLAAALIAALQDYQKQYGSSSDPNPITELATIPDPSAEPGDGSPTTDGSPTVDIAELADDAL